MDNIKLTSNEKETQVKEQTPTIKTYNDIDEVYESIGEYGRKKKILSFIISLFMLCLAWNELAYLFYGLDSSWHCNKPHNLTGSQYIEPVVNKTDDPGNFRNIPVNMTNTCNVEQSVTSYDENFNMRCKINRSDWNFDRSKSFSLVTEMDLVCDKEYLASLVLYFTPCGRLIGLIPAALCDKYGRKPILFLSTLMLGIANVVGYFSYNYIVILITLLITTTFQCSMIASVVTMSCESVGPKARSFAAQIIWASFSVSLSLLAVVAYLIPQWRIMRLVMTIPAFLLLLLWKYVPESPRWLYVNGRTEEAIEVLLRYSDKKNIKIALKDIQENNNKGSLLDLFTNWELIKKDIIYGIINFCMAIIYFGISIAASFLSGNFYFDFALISLTEFPAILVSIYGSNKYGRKPTTMVTLFFCFLTIIGIAVVPASDPGTTNSKLRSCFGILCKFFVSISFNAVYLLAIESYPTSIRSQALSLVNGAIMVGNAIAPWMILGLNKVNPKIPFWLVAAITVANGIACCFATESKGKPTLEVLSQVGHTNEKEDILLTAA